jgi:protein TonB
MKCIFCIVLFLSALYSRGQQATAVEDSANQYSKDTIGLFHKVDIDARYPGGEMAWRKYLEKNFRVFAVSDEVWNELPKKDRKKSYLVFTDTVQFIVCKDGSVCEIKSLTNVPEAFKKETIRLINESKLWQPAQVDGRTVKAYRRQPISLVMSRE